MGTSVYVSNLAALTTEEALAARFGEFGTVLSVKRARDPATGEPARHGFVEMRTTDEARLAASALNATRLDGRVLHVHRASRS